MALYPFVVNAIISPVRPCGRTPVVRLSRGSVGMGGGALCRTLSTSIGLRT